MSPTDRREFFHGMGGITAATVLARVGTVDEEFRAAEPAVVDLAGAEAALARLERDRNRVDPAVLFPPAFAAWSSVETMLSRRVNPARLPHLTRLAGRLASGLAGVATFGGDEESGRALATIAERHAAATKAPLLTARVAGLRSWMALDGGMPEEAADIAARGRQQSDRPDHARLAAYEAEAAATAGDYRRADEALRVMRDGHGIAERGPASLPWTPVEAAIYEAITASHVPGGGANAIRHGEIAIQCPCRCQGVALAHLAVGRGRLDGDRPAPDAAAAAALSALEIDAAAPNSTIRLEARALHRRLVPWSGSEPLVAELGRRVALV